MAALGWAALYTLGLWVVMHTLIIPFASPPLERHDSAAVLFPLHLVFGVWLACVPALRGNATGLDRQRHRASRLRDAALR